MKVSGPTNFALDKVVWEGGTTLHCVSTGSDKPVTIRLCFNQDLADGGQICLVLPLKDRSELKALNDFLASQFDVADRIAEAIRTDNYDRYTKDDE